MNKSIKNLIKMALAEDVGGGDITTNAVIPQKTRAEAKIIAKESGVIAGLPLAYLIYEVLDKKVQFICKIKDGSSVKKGTIIAKVKGPARSILSGERLVLNFLQHLSGIATLTNQFVVRVKGSRVKILDTRKTTPLWRGAEKYAVLAGGGSNHRFGLYDAVMIKDNHIEIMGGIANAVGACRDMPEPIEIECKNISEVKQAISAGVGRILLDNMNLKTLRKAVGLCKKAKIRTEASGGVNIKTVRSIAKTGVDAISIGALTHSAKALDISLEIE
ncbi:MAG: carboxylating nicotinate-nucleotide diphosphorylase [Candidatus Saganbacteria bacterium]|nr:carboxylating nicotinate-nucleotide diphosphorylase [Candidatus Saganbacteria bacterium]